MRELLAAVSLCCAMGTASAQGIAGCGAAHERQAPAGTVDPLADALGSARLPAMDLRSPVGARCDVMAEQRKPARRDQHTAAASSGKRRDARDHRFDMHQNGKQMSADDFDAWMKARGIRIAKGPPPPPKPVAARERKRGR